jgi:hypothetical protein
MKRLLSTPMSGYCRVNARIVLALTALTFAFTACYRFSGGGGFPSHIRTVFIAPIGNETQQFDIEQQIGAVLTERLPRSRGVRLAGERNAHAVVRGTVTRYENAAQNYRPGADAGSVDIIQHQIQVTMTLQIIDVQKNEILYEATGITGRGEYRPDSQSEDVARVKAIELLIQQIIDGAQAQW